MCLRNSPLASVTITLECRQGDEVEEAVPVQHAVGVELEPGREVRDLEGADRLAPEVAAGDEGPGVLEREQDDVPARVHGGVEDVTQVEVVAEAERLHPAGVEDADEVLVDEVGLPALLIHAHPEPLVAKRPGEVGEVVQVLDLDLRGDPACADGQRARGQRHTEGGRAGQPWGRDAAHQGHASSVSSTAPERERARWATSSRSSGFARMSASGPHASRSSPMLSSSASRTRCVFGW